MFKKIMLYVILALISISFCFNDSIIAREQDNASKDGYVTDQTNEEMAELVEEGNRSKVSTKSFYYYDNINNRKIHSYKTQKDTGHLYYTNGNRLYKYSLNDMKETELDYRLPSFNRTDCYMEGDVLFIGNYISSSEFRIIGYDVIQNKEVYNRNFNFLQAIGESFAVDSKWNFYFSVDNAIMIYDKNGVVLDKIEHVDTNNQVSINRLSPNEKILFFNASYYYEGFVPIENNRFVDQNFYLFNSGYRTPNWNFINGSEYAINQYGELAKFDYNNPNTQSKRSYDLVYSLHLANNNFYEISADYDDKNLFIGDDNGNVLMIDYKNGEVLSHKSIGSEKDIVRIDCHNKKLYIIYTDRNTDEYNDVVVDTSDFENVKSTVISNHGTLSRSKDQVRGAYLSSLINRDYGENIFSTIPSTTAPYKAGSLKTNIATEILGHMNYYRWQVGLNKLTINSNYMERSQKGAVILAANDELTHYPDQPSDMSDEFYKEAYAGVNADYNYSGNASWDYSLKDYIKGYIDDTNNLMGDIGHRNSLLDPNAVSTSFGFANSNRNPYYFYNATSIYTSEENNQNNEAFYAWPSSGYTPIESIDVNAKWSITLMDNYDFSKTSINLIVNGKTYTLTDIYLDRYYNVLYFSIPKDLMKQISQKDRFRANTTVNVELNGLRNSVGDKVSIKYPVKFFEAFIENGWNKKDNGEWEYYKNGKLVDGWQSIDGLQYYFRNKEMVHDWFLDEKTQTWYFFNGGVMQRSNLTIGDITYRFDTYGIWRGYDPRWVWYENNYYYRDEWNNNVTGWQSIDGLQYKFREDGTMIRDWYLDEKTQTWYFFNGGVMQRTNMVINGKVNIFDTYGIWRGILK